MSITRSNLRDKVRLKIQDFYKNQDSLSAYLSAATTTAFVTTTTAVRAGDIVEIEDEMMQVTSVNNSSLLVNRGFRGTTAAVHASATAAYVVNNFGKSEYNDAITAALRSLFPEVTQPYTKDLHSYNNRFQLDSLDATTGWSALTDAAAATLNTTDQQEGTGCLNLGFTVSSSAIAGYTKTNSSTMDSSNYEYLNLWIYLTSKKNSSNQNIYSPNKFAEVRVGNNSAAYSYVNVGLDQLNDSGWTLLNLNLQDFSASGTVDKTAVDYMAIYFNDLQSISTGDLKMDEWFLSTYPLTNNMLIKRLPKGMNTVSEARVFLDESSDDYIRETRFEVIDNYIHFKQSSRNNFTSIIDPLSVLNQPTHFWFNQFPQGMPIQLIGDVKFLAPTADADTVTLSDDYEELIVLYATQYLGESMAKGRALTTQLSTQLNRQGGSVLDWLRLNGSDQARYRQLRSQLETGGRPVEFDMGD